MKISFEIQGNRQNTYFAFSYIVFGPSAQGYVPLIFYYINFFLFDLCFTKATRNKDEWSVGRDTLQCPLTRRESTPTKLWQKYNKVAYFFFQGPSALALRCGSTVNRLSVLMLCVPSNRRRPFLISYKMADFLLSVFSWKKLTKCSEYDKYKPQRGRSKRAELPNENINTGVQSINTASLFNLRIQPPAAPRHHRKILVGDERPYSQAMNESGVTLCNFRIFFKYQHTLMPCSHETHLPEVN